MMNYKKEELKLLNMKKVSKYVPNTDLRDGHKIFAVEKELGIDEKIKFIDSMENGIATYLLSIFEKWESEKDGLPKGNWGEVKTVSKKAWIKRNDFRKFFNLEYGEFGSYYLFKNEFGDMSTTCPQNPKYNYDMAYTREHIAHQWFHDLCNQLLLKERKYFEENDTKSIKFKEVKEYSRYYGLISNEKELNDICYNGKRCDDVKESNLDLYIEGYKKVEKFFEAIKKEIDSNIDLS